jgi:hypothetical protein
LCGQENIEPKESFWHLVTHFVYDITHFDGKFFSTVKYLLLKPGFLSGEYITGRRSRYLNPIKMYVFISAFFFLFFFSIQPPFDPGKAEAEQPTYTEVKTKIEKRIENLKTNLKDKDNAEFVEKTMAKQLELLQQDIRTLAKDTTDLSHLNYFKVRNLSVPFSEYRDLAQYDSVQNALPAKDRDKWLKKITAKKGIQLQLKYGDNGMEFFKTLREKFLHSFPAIVFCISAAICFIAKTALHKKKEFLFC